MLLNSNKVHPAMDQELPIPSGKQNLSIPLASVSQRALLIEENPAGLVQNVSDECETPLQLLGRVLVPGEIVIAEFDCYMPYKIIPMWKIIYLSIITLGGFLMTLIYRSFLRMLYRMKMYTPDLVEFSRGKVRKTIFVHCCYYNILLDL